ncbi:MAG TPA: glycosyltransferase family 4 protein [Myxococcota bacterium]|nr:glycosyltransferase family 4 protein [Myxococcota bacterium]
MQFHVLSFEGPDLYSRAGGLASRVEGLVGALCALGFETHLWFVGDPELPGHESRGSLHLHRWAQWISRYHPGGVYDGEHGKHADYSRTLPPHLLEHALRPCFEAGRRAVVLAEEWHTADAVLHLDWLLAQAHLRDRATMLWNANNLFGFERLDLPRIARAATVTTVSRYMKQCMLPLGVDARVVPNGLAEEAFDPPDRAACAELRRRFAGRTLLAKMARWDPDKGWLAAVETVATMKRAGLRPLLLARGGSEPHGAEVARAIRASGLRRVERSWSTPGVSGLLGALRGVGEADVVDLRSHVDGAARRVLFRGVDAVMANSRREPFGLVGLETMAVGGLACTGCTGEDYAMPGQNALVLETEDPGEFLRLFQRLRRRPEEARAMRRAGVATARRFAWHEVVRRVLLPRVELAAGL